MKRGQMIGLQLLGVTGTRPTENGMGSRSVERAPRRRLAGGRWVLWAALVVVLAAVALGAPAPDVPDGRQAAPSAEVSGVHDYPDARPRGLP